MGNESGEWIMRGIADSDPRCIHTMDEMIAYINKVGFLPLFQNEVPGFSVEEVTNDSFWWTGHERDPWLWREKIARSHEAVYGRFFDRKNGFISLRWLPVFANYRRNGYDFDALWDDELAGRREKLIMDCFPAGEEIPSYELKERAGFGKGGEKNFDGIVTALQMQLYLVTSDLQKKRKKNGEEYGWAVSLYRTPEALWGELPRFAYREPPEKSLERILKQMKKLYPKAAEADIRKAVK